MSRTIGAWRRKYQNTSPRPAAAPRAGSANPPPTPVDVFEQMPARNAQHPLLSLDNAICTPHTGDVMRHEYRSQFNKTFDRVLAHAAGAPNNVIQPEVLP